MTTMRRCTFLVIGHMPSDDNLCGLRARDGPIAAGIAEEWRARVESALPLLRCFGQIVAKTYCPTSVRHAESARLLAEAIALDDPVADPRLNNIDYGIFKGRPAGETPPAVGRITVPYEGGESWEQVAGRWRHFCDEQLQRHEGEVVLLAGQSGAAPRMLMHICERTPLKEALAQGFPNLPFFGTGDATPFRTVVWRYTASG